MHDATEWVLGTLAIVLAGAAFAVGGHVLRDAWREVFGKSRRSRSGPADGASRIGQPGQRR